MSKQKPKAFEKAAAEAADRGFFREFLDFLRTNKKWWLLPILVIMLLFGLLILVNSVAPGLAPFIYTLF